MISVLLHDIMLVADESESRMDDESTTAEMKGGAGHDGDDDEDVEFTASTEGK